MVRIVVMRREGGDNEFNHSDKGDMKIDMGNRTPDEPQTSDDCVYKLRAIH